MLPRLMATCRSDPYCDCMFLVEIGHIHGIYQGGGGMWKRDQHSFFFFRGLLDTAPPSTFLIEYVFPILMSFFYFNSEDLHVTSKLITGGCPPFDVD